MRLRKVKLAGFKSFVDPTTIALPGELIGVVGPNGCGKSNIIDAVRWVMGESSAKHLRGDSMADVVFNGSTSRKPVGQASVELVFDNSDGRLGGQYANFTEIAVKRQVGRDGQSVYILNGTRCRRRDITDIFLGTGLGARSYAIIEQGMISRLIEAKPEELRDFLEEAAGISKYKERRRETENRIRHTKENLERLSDLREELGKRLQHLKRQATMAEKYRVLKQEELLLRAQLLALRWRELDGQATHHERRIGEQATTLEAALAEQRRLEADLEKQRETQTAASEEFNDVYRRVLDAGADIARVEEMIQSLRQRREQLQESLAREEQALAGAKEHAAAEQRRRNELSGNLEHDEPELERLERASANARLEFRQAEEAMQEWQRRGEALSELAAAPTQTAHAERARIQQLEAHMGRLQQRLNQLDEEHGGLDPSALEQQIAVLAAQLQHADTEHVRLQNALRSQQASIHELRDQVTQGSAELHAARERVQESRGRLASLQALQQDALGQRPGEVMEWLQARGLDDLPRLAQRLRVAPGWERALETVLGFHLEAVCADGATSMAEPLDALEKGALTLFDTAADHVPAGVLAGPALSEKVEAPWPVRGLMDGVCAAETVDDAVALRARLGPRESVITRSGVWMGANWIRVAREAEAGAGILAREQEIKSLKDVLVASDAVVERLNASHEETRERLRAAEDEHAELQNAVTDHHGGYATLKSSLAAVQAQFDQARTRAGDILTEIAGLQEQRAADERALSEARQSLERATDEMAKFAHERELWEASRQQLREQLDVARERSQQVRDDLYQVGLRVESIRTQLTSLEQNDARNRDQAANLEARCAELRERLGQTDGPLAENQQNLEQKLVARREVETILKDARAKVEDAESTLRDMENRRHAAEDQVSAERSTLDQLRMDSQAIKVRRETVVEQAAETGHGINALLEELPDGAGEPEWAEKLETVEKRISRLGPINLAAIEEFEQQSERKVYLDAQDEDLVEALSTLESAIHKIDRETRARFKETYDKVNTGLGQKFPKLFGGGEAELQLTGDDLLNAGVSVMARPPGKRNSTIHLLSGGEKALTAVALVFSIFELNPAPFCLLDEVDAPLDDANIARFCQLVKDMSEQVQFVVVTHNKASMEMAQQLIGVTMHEPGVSRLVAVDLDEAAEMAAG